MTDFVVHAPVAVNIRTKGRFHGTFIAEESHSVAVAEHKVIEVHARQNALRWNTVVFDGSVEGVLLLHNLVVGLSQFLSFLIAELLQELHRISQLHVACLDIHNRTHGLVQQAFPVLIGLLFGIKISVDFSGYEMDGDGRCGFRIIRKIVDIYISRFLHVDYVHSLMQAVFLSFQSPALRIFSRFETRSRLTHPVRNEQTHLASVQVAHQHHILTFLQIHTGDVLIAAVSVVKLQLLFQNLVRWDGSIAAQQVL